VVGIVVVHPTVRTPNRLSSGVSLDVVYRVQRRAFWRCLMSYAATWNFGRIFGRKRGIVAVFCTSTLRWYTIYTFFFGGGGCCPITNSARCKIHFASKSCVLLYWQRYCTALEQRASAKSCGMLQGIELLNFRRGRHLYSSVGSSRWASAQILVCTVISGLKWIIMRI